MNISIFVFLSAFSFQIFLLRFALCMQLHVSTITEYCLVNKPSCFFCLDAASSIEKLGPSVTKRKASTAKQRLGKILGLDKSASVFVSRQ